jgi:hypothetical protein
MLVRSEKTPMGLVLRRTSRKRRSMALVVRTALRSDLDRLMAFSDFNPNYLHQAGGSIRASQQRV